MALLKTIAIRLLILLDCIANMLLSGSINQTLSARAHFERARGQRWWKWTADRIDALPFWSVPDHCHQAFLNEQARGGALWWLREILA